MAIETLFPTAVITSGNVNNAAVTLVNEDIDTGSPDTDFVEWDGNGNVSVYYSFDTPTGQLLTGANLQNFRVRLRKNGGSNTPQYQVVVVENGTTRATSATQNITSTSFVEFSFTWNANILALQNGSGVEIQVNQTNGGGGNPNRRAGIDIAAINWDLSYDPPVGAQAEANVVWV